MPSKKPNRYERLLEHVFQRHYAQDATEVAFAREDLEQAAKKLELQLPKNLGDVIYAFRYRTQLPESIQSLAPKGMDWIIRAAGQSKYRFVLTSFARIRPATNLAVTKVPDSTPGVISMYSMTDEQALLAKIRYNRLIDIFSGVACYSLQSHLRTTVNGMGQVETDEIYVGVDKRGAHYVFPIQAKGGKDTLGIVQVEQDVALCAEKFGGLICRPIGAQFLGSDLIAMIELEESQEGLKVVSEKHYRLVPSEEVSSKDIAQYRRRSI